MAGLQLSGLASGFDWKSVVDQLMAIERVPQDRLRTEKSGNTSKLTSFATFRTKLADLQSAAKALTADSLFGKRSLAFSNTDLKWTATAENSTQAGEYLVNVSKLATRTARRGGADIAAALGSDVSSRLVSDLRLASPITAGTFTVNGAQVVVEETDTLADVFDKIATATGGDVAASYSAATDRVTLAGVDDPETPEVDPPTVTLGASSDTSNFLYALKLYNNGSSSISSASTLGTVALNESIADSGLGDAIPAVDAEGDGSFTVNGVTIAYNVNTDSLQAVMNRVNSSAAGVTMGYDAANDRFTLTNKNTGSLGLSVAETAGGLLDALDLNAEAAVTLGNNAEFSIDGGGTIVNASNSLDESAHGISGLTINATSEGQQTVTVASDTDSLEDGINAFVKAFNDVQKFIDDQTKVTLGSDGKVTKALMAGNQELTSIARDLRNRVFAAVPGLTGDVRRLEAIGIDFEGSSSQLSVKDSAKLADALANNLDEVGALFTTSTDGIAAKLDDYVTAILGTNGTIDAQENSIERQNSALDKQIADIERRLEAERTRLEESFIRMEEAQSLINQQLASLNGILNS